MRPAPILNRATSSPEQALNALVSPFALDASDLESTRQSLAVALDAAWAAQTLHDQGLQSLARYWTANLERAETLAQDRRRFPDIRAVQITAPLVVAGQPRSGTTFLQALLAQDPANRSIATWEAEFPSPPPIAAESETDPRIVAWGALQGGDLATPGKNLNNRDLHAKHLMEATLPDECGAIMASTTRTLGAWSIAPLAPFMHWWCEADLTHPYRAHRQWLQHLQWRHPRERWVLKYPAHMAALDYLFAQYPDALVVQTHRRPEEIVSSLTSLFLSLRQSTVTHQDPHGTGLEILDHIRIISEKTLAYRRANPAARIIDVSYRRLQAEPLKVVGDIYDRFDLALSGEAEERMAAFLAAFPQGKKGEHLHSLDSYGLSAEAVRETTSGYVARFEAFH